MKPNTLLRPLIAVGRSNIRAPRISLCPLSFVTTIFKRVSLPLSKFLVYDLSDVHTSGFHLRRERIRRIRLSAIIPKKSETILQENHIPPYFKPRIPLTSTARLLAIHRYRYYYYSRFLHRKKSDVGFRRRGRKATICYETKCVRRLAWCRRVDMRVLGGGWMGVRYMVCEWISL